MKKISIFFMLGLIFIVASCNNKTQEPIPTKKVATLSDAESKGCQYSTDLNQIKMEWTAFKTTKKVAVKGSFNSAKVSGPNVATSLQELAVGLKMNIDGASIESGDPGRNVTVKEFFFAKFNPPFLMTAKGSKLEGTDEKGRLDITLDLNGVIKPVSFDYVINENALVATSKIEMSDFNLKAAFDSIHEACEELHTGEDGISKTWEDVELKVVAPVKKECS